MVRERGTDFADRVRMEVGVPTEQGELLCRRMVELTSGRCEPRKLGEGMDLK